MLKGKGVILRPCQESDLPLFIKWLNDREVAQHTNIYLPITETSEKEFIEKIMKEQQPVLTIERILKNGKTKPIGNCGIMNINYKNRNGEFGIVIGDKKSWGKGLGFEAAQLIIDYGFYTLNLHRIESSVHTGNLRSMALRRNLGFRQEGTKKSHIYSNGRYVDLIMYGLLKTEWDKKRNK